MLLNYAAFAVLVLLQALDVITTYRLITSGLGRERNRVIGWLIAHLGLKAGLVLPKIVFVVLAWCFLLEHLDLLFLLCAVYAGIVAWNWSLKYSKLD
jgi:hypothetical protein